MALTTDLITFENPVFRALIFYECLLVLKMMAMSILTGLQRKKHKAFTNPEDAQHDTRGLKPKVHEDVERVRRAHLNDLENIIIFFCAAWMYLLTGPTPFIATNLIRAFTIARFAHTFVYAIYVVPQPARGLSWFVGYIITGYMVISTILHVC